MTRSDLQKLAAERIADAKALLAMKRWSAAYYLAGYAVECGLKACIAKLTKAEEFPISPLPKSAGPMMWIGSTFWRG